MEDISDDPAEQAPAGELARYLGADALSTREAAVAARADLTRRRAELERQQAQLRDDLERRRAELEAEFAKARADLMARMAPLKAQLEKMQEVMWTVDLYLGRDESLRLIRDGAPAPADTPITIRQKVLVMAEESLIHLGSGKTGMDADDVPDFVRWLCEDDTNLDRVLPEQKGVVVLIPTRVQVKSGNIFEDAHRDAANQRSYWLLRNGERLYLLTVDPELRILDRVLPRRREFVEVFDRRLFGFGRSFGEPIRPGSEEWFELEKIADAKRRHYMRILLVLEGIIDRTPVWHPLPADGVSMMSLADQDAGKIVLLQDDEDSIQLGEGGETFTQWQKRLNSMLRPGLRVIGDWSVRDFRELRVEGDRFARGYHPRLHPANVASLPAANVPHVVEGRRDGGVVIRFARTDSVYRRNVPVPGKPGYVYRGEYPVEATQRASCVIMPTDTWVLPFDLVTTAELEKYLYSREERSKHLLDMVPTLRAALEAKRDEADAERDFRDLLGRALVMEGADAQGIDAVVDGLVHWWKLSHTWTKPLNGDGAHEKKAAEQILAEYRARQVATADAAEADMIAAGRTVDGVIAIARDRQGRWAAYSPSVGAHEHGVYLDVTRIRRDGTIGSVDTWKLLTQRSASALHVAWAAPEWDAWRSGANPRHHITQPERQQLIEELRELAPGPVLAVTELHDPNRPGSRGLAAYFWIPGTAPADTEAWPAEDPLDWRTKQVIGVTRRLVTRGRDGSVSLVAADRWLEEGARGYFSSFSAQTRWGDVPWWPDDAPDFGDVRPRLAWADEALLDEVSAFRARCRELRREQRAAESRVSDEAQKYVAPVMESIRERMESAVRARFEEDFGPDADDLWPAHLAALGLRDPIHSRDVWGIIAIAIQHGEPVVGRTLAELAESARSHRNIAPGEWHPDRGAVDVKEYGDVVVPELEAEEPES